MCFYSCSFVIIRGKRNLLREVSAIRGFIFFSLRLGALAENNYCAVMCVVSSPLFRIPNLGNSPLLRI